MQRKIFPVPLSNNPSFVQLTRSGVVIGGSDEDFERLRLEYARQHYLILPRLIEPELLDAIADRVETAPYQTNDHDGLALELVMDDISTVALLNFLMNRPEFLRQMERVLGLRQIGRVSGHVYRMTSTDGHYQHWHNDILDRRMAALSLNLTREKYRYRGGSLQMRYSNSESILHELHNSGFGDALVFRISRKLQHRVMPIEGETPKVAYAGWFRWGTTYHENLRRDFASIQTAHIACTNARRPRLHSTID